MDNKNIFHNNKKLQIFETNVVLKYQIYNGLFLNLPFNDIDQAGARLTIFSHRCEDGLKAKLSPQQIIETYLNRVNVPKERHFDLLFKFVQFIERQILLFDALEDATFSNINNLSGDGSIDNFLQKVINRKIEAQMSALLNTYKTRIVLTAHPTQFYPNAVLGIILNMGNAIKNNKLNEIPPRAAAAPGGGPSGWRSSPGSPPARWPSRGNCCSARTQPTMSATGSPAA